jgi:hypothetical protein
MGLFDEKTGGRKSRDTMSTMFGLPVDEILKKAPISGPY